MKKSPLVAAALTGLLAPWAMAQTADSVQLYGTITAGVTVKNHQTGGKSVKEMTNSPLMASWIGVRGTEDLGGGMSAVYRLESGINTDTGAQTLATKFWNRQSFVGLNLNPMATVTVGRQFHAAVDRMIQTLDVNNIAGTQLATVPLALFGVNRFSNNDGRTDDSIKLRLRGPMGLVGGLSGGMDDGTGRSYSLDVAQITPNYAVAAMYVQYRSPTGIARTGVRPEHTAWAVGGNMLAGPVRLYLTYIDSSLDSATQPAAPAPLRIEQKNRIVHLGAAWAASAQTTVKAAYYNDRGRGLNGVTGRDGTKNTLVLTADYALSKRTSLNAGLFTNRFSGGYVLEAVNIAGLNRDPAATSTQGYTVGVRHDF